MRTARKAIFAVATAGIALAPAGPATADPADGNYTGTIIDGGGAYEEGSKAPFTLNPCGPDCIHLTQTGSGWVLHRQGSNWVGQDEGDPVNFDEGSLVLTVGLKRGHRLVIGLTKDA
jgi:hypothetical protein